MDKKIVEKARKKGYKISRVDRFRYRCRYFTDSGVIGGPVKSCVAEPCYGISQGKQGLCAGGFLTKSSTYLGPRMSVDLLRLAEWRACIL